MGSKNMTALGAISPPEQPRCRYVVDCAGARLCVYARSLATIVRIDGEIDASNAERIAHEIRRFARVKAPLILDLSHLDFLSVDGFRALLVLNHEHHKAGLHCSVIAGPAIRPLLRIVINHGLPVADSIAEALQLVEDVISSRRQFLAGLVKHREPQRRTPLAQVSGDRR
ncbi:STAS domain-containing protein [Mycobacterium kansasii]|uniref:STAS domain-containing protein n=1 Tax=Mycobacterium kansasii TaxID=1768 RepID=UPI0030B93863